MTEMVRLDRLAKRFGPVHAVEEISFTVARGEVLGFLGPNGAGKSTTMRMLTGFITPSSGSASGDGLRRRAPADRGQAAGRLPARGCPALRRHDRRWPSCASWPRCAGSTGEDGKRRIDAAIGRTQLEEVAHRPIETLSKGFKRRVGLAQAIMHDPPVLVLDEPTDGLDPNQKHGVRQLIAEMAGDKAIVISTHILEEVEAICTRAVIIARGRIVADAKPDELKRRSRHHNAVRLTVNANLQPKLQPMLADLPGVRSVEVVGAVNGVASLLVGARAGRRDRPRGRRAGAAQRLGGRRDRGRAGAARRRVSRPHQRRALRSAGPCCTPSAPSSPASSRPTSPRPLAYVFIVIFLALTGVAHLLPGRLLRARAGRPRAVLPVPPLALSVPGPGDRHAAVGRGAAHRHDRAADDAADHDLRGRARQVPGRLGLRRYRAPAHLPDVADRQLAGRAGQRRHPGLLPRQLGDGGRLHRHRRLRLGADQEPGDRLRGGGRRVLPVPDERHRSGARGLSLLGAAAGGRHGGLVQLHQPFRRS